MASNKGSGCGTALILCISIVWVVSKCGGSTGPTPPEPYTPPPSITQSYTPSAPAQRKYAPPAYQRAEQFSSQDSDVSDVSDVPEGDESADDASDTDANAPGELSNGDYYTNSDGVSVHRPAYSQDGPPAGASAQCRDGTYSFSMHRSGTCSHHGGVAQWL